MPGDLLERWLELRLIGVPEGLGIQVRESLADRRPANSAEDVAAAFCAAALGGLDQVGAGPQSRGDALRLLAADACLTYAFEAAADLDGDPVSIARQVGARGALGERIRQAMAQRSGEA